MRTSQQMLDAGHIIPHMLFDHITIVGVGLIGGSVGLAAKARGVARRVVGTGRDPANLARAAELGVLDSHTTSLAEAVMGSELVVVCTPVDRIAEIILAAAPHCRPGSLFTDGGSTKGRIVAAVEGRLPKGVTFIPAHPIAGSEKNGVEHARADLFEDRLTITTPPSETEAAAVERVEAFWRALGSHVVRMNPKRHDQILAGTSHLPHAVAAALASVIPVECLPYSAGGFRDTTRIAGGDPNLWAPIFLENDEAVLLALEIFQIRLDMFRELLKARDRNGLVQWLTEGKQVRDALGTGNPPEGA